MTKPAACQCAQKYCSEGRCHARTIFKWTGDFDFTNNRTIADFPGYRAALDNGQENPTSMVWRIRYDFEDLDFLEYMITNDLTAQNGAVRNASWQDQASKLAGYNVWTPIPNVGAVRDGVMVAAALSSYRYQVSVTPLHNMRLSGWQFQGQAFTYHAGEITSTPFPVHVPEAPANVGKTRFSSDLPWALDIGCVRCGFSHGSITWPDVSEYYYTPATTAFADWFRADEDRVLNHDLTRNRDLACDEYETAAVYFAGDGSDDLEPPPCTPAYIGWHHTWSRSPAIRAALDAGNDNGSNSAANTPAHANAAKYHNYIDTGGETFTTCDFAAVDVVALYGDHLEYNGAGSPYNAALSAGQLSALSDWLDLGGKTLILTSPGTFSVSLIDTGDPGGLLAGIGCTMRLSNAAWTPLGYPAAYDEYWQKTADPLATDLPASSFWARLTKSGYVNEAITGGTVLLNAYRPDEPVNQTYPIIAYETLASGSRVILFAMERYGVADTQYITGGRVGLHRSIVTQLITNALNGL